MSTILTVLLLGVASLFLVVCVAQVAWSNLSLDKLLYQYMTGRPVKIYYCVDCEKYQSVGFCTSLYPKIYCGHCHQSGVVEKLAIWKGRPAWDFITFAGEFVDFRKD